MKVIIIGGVAAGASAAARLRRLDEHCNILLLEKGKFISDFSFCLHIFDHYAFCRNNIRHSTEWNIERCGYLYVYFFRRFFCVIWNIWLYGK